MLDVEFFEASPERRLIAVDDRFAQILFQVRNGFDHPRIRAAQKITVGIRPAIFFDDSFPLSGRHRRIGMRFKTEPHLMQHLVTNFTQIVHFELIGGLNIGAYEHELLDSRLIESLRDRLRCGDGRTAAADQER